MQELLQGVDGAEFRAVTQGGVKLVCYGGADVPIIALKNTEVP